MARRNAPLILDALLDQLLAGRDPQSALGRGGLLDELKRALAERALNAEMDCHLCQSAWERDSGSAPNRGSVAFLVMLPTWRRSCAPGACRSFLGHTFGA